MKKTVHAILAVLMLLGMTACGSKKQGAKTGKAFRPALDASVKGHVNFAGGYDNFEAQEIEFKRFNEYYPNVELVYTKIDDSNNMVGMVLNGKDASDVYVHNSWMYGREQYKASIEHAEDLSDPSLGLDLACIRSNILLNFVIILCLL